MEFSNTHKMQSDFMIDLQKKCRLIAPSSTPVLIVGEFGTGKGWIARYIHSISDRERYPFSRINCYSMGAEEVSRKLFGYLSFTGHSAKINRGLFEESNRGTIFFEGFDVLPADIQQQIIESVQTKKISHLGSSLHIHTDVRLITSMYGHSYQNSRNYMRPENLIYEVNPHIIFQSPLRNRREDISPLIKSLLKTMHMKGEVTNNITIAPDALYKCIHYNWPGNIRQLKNAIRQAAILSGGDKIELRHLPESVRNGQPVDDKLLELQQSQSFQKAEKLLLEELFDTSESPEKIAELLGITTRSVAESLERYQLKKNMTTQVED
jgi:DNA-binding NtrC family response regulator